MKKNLLTTLLSFVALSLSFAQLPFYEPFTTGIPNTWQNVDNTANNGGVWQWINDSGEQFVVFDSDGYGNDNKAENADLISPSINCTGQSFVALSFLSGFTQYANSIGRVSVSNDGGTTWTQVYSVNTDNTEQTLINISAYAANQANVKIKFNYQGNWDYFWVVDDVTVYAPATKDVAGVSINNGTYNALADAPFTITGTLVNLGSEVVNSLTVNYKVDGGSAVSANLTGLNIAFGAEYNFSHTVPFNPSAAATYEITAYASSINGGADANTANDEVSKDLVVYDVAVQRVPLFEVLTSSTCPPCKPGNEKFHSIVDTKPSQDYVAVKYQQDFPGTGDPYCTTESVNRRNFYGVNAIPAMEIDGGWNQNANSFTEALYTDARTKPAFTFLHATYDVDVATQTVNVEVEGLPIQDFGASTYKLHVAVIENLTDNNVKTNGETEFYQVMKKMVPDNNGTTVDSLVSLNPFTLSTSFEFKGTYRLPANGQTANRINHATENSVEEFSDLRVVVWIEDQTNKDVLQAFNAVAALDTDGDGVPDEVEAYSGTSSTDPNDFPDLDDDGLSDWKEVTDGTNPLERANAIKEVAFEMNVALSPVPASSVLNVAFTLASEEEVALSIISVDGKVMSTQNLSKTANVKTSFDVNALSNGVYFLEVRTASGVSSKSFTVSK